MRSAIYAMLLMCLGAACGDDKSAAANDEICHDMSDGLEGDCVEGRTWESCCDRGGTQCRYIFSDGTEFECAEISDSCINWAAQAAAQYCAEGTK